MAGKNIIAGAQPVEWLKETNFATVEDEATWNWFGLGTSWSVDNGVETESIRYLPQYGDSGKLEKRVNVSHREIWDGEVTYHPQNFDLLEFFTGASGGTSDTVPSIQVGEVNESVSPEEFRRIYGGVGEECTLSVGEDETAEITGSFKFADAEDWGTTDYTADTDADGTSGSHAVEDTTEPFKYADLSNVQYGGANISDAIESLELGISQDLAVVRDPDSTNNTLIDAMVPVDREITVDLDLTYSTFDMQSEVRAYTPKDFTFDIGATSFTVGDVQFPEAPYEFSADDLISDSISSDPASSLSWV